jgi:hypothetical protein
MKYIFGVLCTLLCTHAFTQVQVDTTEPKAVIDSIFIASVEIPNPDKVLHAEPLFIDLIRDLGARKGEREWNVGVGITDKTNFDAYTMLVEYEWAPINRLGFEVELPFTIYPGRSVNKPGSQLNSLKLASQYTFFVQQQAAVSMAFGYIHEFLLPTFKNYGKAKTLRGHVHNPFLIVAKRWGQNWHSLLYTGPIIENEYGNTHSQWQLNSNVHYMIRGTRNFVGLEINQSFTAREAQTVLRPQIRVGVADNLLIGIVAGIPIQKNQERLSQFIRLIYEPTHRRH